MCGIAGIWGTADRMSDVHRMVACLDHRGPDGASVYLLTNATLGFTRLAIMDVEHGGQPFVSGDGQVSVVANGEIYNYPVMRRQLESESHFKTGSDCEVILHQYLRHGRKGLSELQGMFACAIIDGDKLILVRDALGIKPLYYALQHDPQGNTVCYFASEMKALLSWNLEIQELPPGSVWSPGEAIQQYYQVPQGWTLQQGNPLPDLQQIRATLEASVNSHLMSDVPVGVMLSGGLDSSVIAALAKKQVGELHSFAVGVEGGPDLEAARYCAREIGTIHHERILRAPEVTAKLPEIIWRLESFCPLMVRPAIANYFCAELAADYLKVVLSGEGADELYAGYDYHKNYRNAASLHQELHRNTAMLHKTNLQRADRMTMAFGLEARVPFLDQEVVRLGMETSPFRKLGRLKPWNRRIEKLALRQAFTGLLPDRLLYRPKMTFNTGSGLNELLPDAISAHQTGDSVADYRAIHPRAGIYNQESLVYHRLLVESCGNSRSFLDNVYPWMPTAVKEDQPGPFRGRRRHYLRMQ